MRVKPSLFSLGLLFAVSVVFGARLWIEHDLPTFDTLRRSPAFYQ
jgi:hypothetical protein